MDRYLKFLLHINDLNKFDLNTASPKKKTPKNSKTLSLKIWAFFKFEIMINSGSQKRRNFNKNILKIYPKMNGLREFSVS